jgi:hypothetical protein
MPTCLSAPTSRLSLLRRLGWHWPKPRAPNHGRIVAKEGRDLRPRFVKSLTDHLERIRPERGAIDGVAFIPGFSPHRPASSGTVSPDETPHNRWHCPLSYQWPRVRIHSCSVLSPERCEIKRARECLGDRSSCLLHQSKAPGLSPSGAWLTPPWREPSIGGCSIGFLAGQGCRACLRG